MATPAKPTRKPSPDIGGIFEGFDSYNSNIVETTVLMDGPGVLFGLVVNTAQSGATCSIFDASTLQGGIGIPNVNRKGSILLANQGTIAYEAKMTRGLLIQTSQGVGGIPADVTFIFKHERRERLRVRAISRRECTADATGVRLRAQWRNEPLPRAW